MILFNGTTFGAISIGIDVVSVYSMNIIIECQSRESLK